MNISDIRAKYPMYNDMSDKDLLDLFHDKFYPNDDRQQFYKDYGLQTTPPGTPDAKGQVGGTGTWTDDMGRILIDSASRGMADKAWDKEGLGGGRNQADTAAARERHPYMQFPADIAGALLGSPKRAWGAGAGLVSGGAEGFANAYGHQKNWYPSSVPEAVDLAKGTAVGAGAGLVGGLAGDLIGRYGSKALNYLRQGYRSDAELQHAINSGAIVHELPQAQAAMKNIEDIRGIQQGARIDELHGLKGTRARDELERWTEASGMPPTSPPMVKARSMLERADRPPSNLGLKWGAAGAGTGGTLGGTAGWWVANKAGINPAIASGIGTGIGTTIGGAGGYAGGKAADALLNAGRGGLRQVDFNELASILRDPRRGVGTGADMELVRKARDTLSQIFVGATRGAQ